MEDTNNLLNYVRDILKTQSVKYLAENLNITAGTILRWIELGNVPKQYEFDYYISNMVETSYK